MAFRAELQRERPAIIRRSLAPGEVKTRERLPGDVSADGGRERRIADQVGPGRMDGQRSGGMTLITGGTFKLNFLAVEIGEIIRGRFRGEVLNDGKVSPPLV